MTDANISIINIGNIKLVTDGRFSVLRTADQFVITIEDKILGAKIYGPFNNSLIKVIYLIFKIDKVITDEELNKLDQMIQRKQLGDAEEYLKGMV